MNKNCELHKAKYETVYNIINEYIKLAQKEIKNDCHDCVRKVIHY